MNSALKLQYMYEPGYAYQRSSVIDARVNMTLTKGEVRIDTNERVSLHWTNRKDFSQRRLPDGTGYSGVSIVRLCYTQASFETKYSYTFTLFTPSASTHTA